MEPVEAPKPKHTAEPDEATTAAPQAGREQDGALDDVDALMAQLAERQVNAAFDNHVDDCNVQGFMHALGYSAFKAEGEDAFTAALKATDQSGAQGRSTWDRELAAAAHSLLIEWQAEAESS